MIPVGRTEGEVPTAQHGRLSVRSQPKPSVWVVAYRDVRRPVALIVVLALATLMSMLYPTDLHSYTALHPDANIPRAVEWTEDYVRFVPTMLQIALPLVLGDKVGLVQLAYVGVATTIATHGAKRVLNDQQISDTRLGQRPSRHNSKHNMPSGHSSMASCAVYFIGRRYGLRIALLLTPILLLTMYTRVALNAHSVSAVVAGALLGFLMTALFTSRRTPEPAPGARPARTTAARLRVALGFIAFGKASRGAWRSLRGQAINILKRNNVVVSGRGTRPIVFAHGFGCDQQMWRFVAPAFEATHRVLLFDHIGCGKSDITAYDNVRHASLAGYAADLVEILEHEDLHDAIVVGHSVSAMIAVLVAVQAPHRVAKLVLVGPSPRYLNDPPDYVGGFERADIDGLMDMMESNMLGWADFLAPAVMGASSGQEPLTQELKESFCAADPYITRRFAAATFLGDNRADLPLLKVPSLIIQCSNDAIAPQCVGDYVHAQLQGSTLRVIEASGHCPHMTHPAQTIALIRDYVALP